MVVQSGEDNQKTSSRGKTKNLSFFKIILPLAIQDHQLRIPGKFVKKLGEDLSDVAVLKVPTGEVWNVSLKKADGEIWFCDGWRKFVEYHSIQVGHFLVFRYEGNSSFHVVIFDTSCTEIEYKSNVVEESNHGGHPVHNGDKEVEVEAESSMEMLGKEFGFDYNKLFGVINVDEDSSSDELSTSSTLPFTSNKGKRAVQSLTKQKPSLEELVQRESGDQLSGGKHKIPASDEVESSVRKVEGRHEVERAILKEREIKEDSSLEIIDVSLCQTPDSVTKIEDNPSAQTNFPLRSCAKSSVAKRTNPLHETALDCKRRKTRSFLPSKRLNSENQIEVDITEVESSDEDPTTSGQQSLSSSDRKHLNPSTTSKSHTRTFRNTRPSFHQQNQTTGLTAQPAHDFEAKQEDGRIPASRRQSDSRPLSTRTKTVKDIDAAFQAPGGFKPQNPFFSVTMHQSHVSNKYYVSVPYSFMNRYTNKCLDATLVSDDGRKWPSKIFYYQGTSKICQGWKAFAMVNNLMIGDVCIFELIDAKEAVLKVSIFRISQFATPFAAIEKKAMENDLGHSLNTTANAVESNIFRLDSKNVIDGHDTRLNQEEGRKCRSGRQLRSRDSVTSVKRKAWLKKQETDVHTAFRSSNPFFSVVMQPTYVARSYNCHLPHTFMKAYTRMLDHATLFITDGGRRWPCKLLLNGQSFKFCKGWQAFATENNLKVADVCVFELIDDTEETLFKVSIFRSPEYVRPVEAVENNSLSKNSARTECEKGLNDGNQIEVAVIDVESSTDEPTISGQQSNDGNEESSFSECDQPNQDDLDLDQDDGEISVSEGIPDSMTLMTMIKCLKERKRAVQAARKFKSDNPFCTKTMTPSYVPMIRNSKPSQDSQLSYPRLKKADSQLIKTYGCHIPLAFMKAHTRMRNHVTLVSSDGEKRWRCESAYYRDASACWVGGPGWNAFATENNLKVEDICVFELIDDSEETVIKVSIFRAGLSVKPVGAKFNHDIKFLDNSV